MPDDEFDDGVQVEDDGHVARLGSEDAKALRKQAKKGRRAAELERENAFLKAGLDPDDDRHAFFMNGYDGELDKEAILAKAADLGFVEKPETTTPGTETQETDTVTTEAETQDPDLSAISALHDAAAAAGAESAPSHEAPTEDPYVRAAKVHDEVLETGGKRDEAGAAAFAEVTQAALARDRRVLSKVPAGAEGPQG